MAIKIRKVCEECGTHTVSDPLLVVKEVKEGCSCGCPEAPKFTVLSAPPKQ